MKNALMERMTELKDRAYDKIFAKRIELEKKKNFWKVLFIVTASILGAVIVGFVVYTVLKKKFNNDIIARLKARFSREDDDLDVHCKIFIIRQN